MVLWERMTELDQARAVPVHAVPATRLTAETMAPEIRNDAFLQTMGRAFDMSSWWQVEPGGTDVSVTAWHLHDLVCIDARYGAHHVHKTRKRLRQEGRDAVRISMARSGTSTIVVGEDANEIGTGEIFVHDACSEFQWIGPEADYISVYVPYEALGYDPARHRSHLSVPLDTPVGRMMRAAWTSMHGNLDFTSQTDAPDIATAFAGMLRGLLMQGGLTEETRGQVEHARRQAIRDFIDDHLGDPELNLQQVARAVGATRSTLYRELSDEGGFYRYLRKRRMARAYRDLSLHVPTRGRVTQVAERWGFTSIAQFSRQFREEFGMAPGEVMRQQPGPAPAARPAAPKPSCYDTVYSWIRGN